MSMKLLNHFGVKKPLISYHEHNHVTAGQSVLNRLLAGESCALMTDAGTPAISDPGEDLVRLCAENGVEVRAIPGCCAAVNALAVSGLPTGRFTFEGNSSLWQGRISHAVRPAYPAISAAKSYHEHTPSSEKW